MGDALQSETLSITTGAAQTLFLDEKDRDLIKGKRVALIDDVISTGSTLQGMRLIMEKAGATGRRRSGDLHRRRPRHMVEHRRAGASARLHRQLIAPRESRA